METTFEKVKPSFEASSSILDLAARKIGSPSLFWYYDGSTVDQPPGIYAKAMPNIITMRSFINIKN
jgi:hypothetical protein